MVGASSFTVISDDLLKAEEGQSLQNMQKKRGRGVLWVCLSVESVIARIMFYVDEESKCCLSMKASTND